MYIKALCYHIKFYEIVNKILIKVYGNLLFLIAVKYHVNFM